jgi:glycosyltransferase involved in cell wall biosynthesis
MPSSTYMHPEAPFFSLIIPTYNRAALIGKTLQSVLAQKFSNYEVIVVDDGSTDETEKMILDIGNFRVRYFKKENGERGAARNFGWEKATGRYITFLDSDDLIHDHHLDTAYHYLQSRTDVVAYAQAYHVVDGSATHKILRKHQTRPAVINNALLHGNFLSCFGVFVKRTVGSGLRFEERRLFAGSEDWLLWLRLAARHPFYYNNMVTGVLVQHSGRSVMAFSEASLQYRAAHLKAQLKADSYFAKAFGPRAAMRLYGHMLSYAALHLAMIQSKKKAIKYLVRAVAAAPNELFTRRTIAIFKKLISE